MMSFYTKRTKNIKVDAIMPSYYNVIAGRYYMEQKKASIRMPIHLDIELSKIAKRDGISKNALVLVILKNYLENEKKERRRTHRN